MHLPSDKSRCLSGVKRVGASGGWISGGGLFEERMHQINFIPAFEKIPKVILSTTETDYLYKPRAAERRPETKEDNNLILECGGSIFRAESVTKSSFAFYYLLCSEKGEAYLHDFMVSWMACA